jgi:hypothetical protein
MSSGDDASVTEAKITSSLKFLSPNKMRLNFHRKAKVPMECAFDAWHARARDGGFALISDVEMVTVIA